MDRETPENSFLSSFKSVPPLGGFHSIVKEALPNLEELKATILRSGAVGELAPSGNKKISRTFLEGRIGVGKSTALISICYDDDIRRRFRGGIYFVSFSLSGEDCEIAEHLCGLISLSGGQNTADAIRTKYRSTTFSDDPLEDVVSGVRNWFKSEAALFVFDNISYRLHKSGKTFREWPDLLSDIIGNDSQSHILICSRFPKLAAPYFTLIHFRELDMSNEAEKSAAIRLMEEYAGVQRGSTYGYCAENVRDILPCVSQGLQLAICMVGNIVRSKSGRWTQVLQSLQSNEVIAKEVNGIILHKGLKFNMKIVLESLEKDDRNFGKFFGYSSSELTRSNNTSFTSMYENLGLLPLARSVPLSLLRTLFGTKTEVQAKATAEFLCVMGLAKVEQRENVSDVLRLHDLQFYCARALCIDRTSIEWKHRLFIERFAYFRFGENASLHQVDWSVICTSDSVEDEYVSQNLIDHMRNAFPSRESPECHLVKNNVREAIVSTLTDFKWIRDRAYKHGRCAIIRDYRVALEIETGSYFDDDKRRIMTQVTAEQKNILVGGIRAAVEAICEILVAIHPRSFLPSLGNCETHEKGGGPLASELIGRLSSLSWKDNGANGLIRSLKGSVMMTVDGPWLLPMHGVYREIISLSTRSGATAHFRATGENLDGIVFAGERLVTVDAYSTLAIYSVKDNYKVQAQGVLPTGINPQISVAPRQDSAQHDLVVVAGSGVVCLLRIPDDSTGEPPHYGGKINIKNDPGNPVRCADRYPRVQNVDISRRGDVLVALVGYSRLHIWRRIESGSHTNDSTYRYHPEDIHDTPRSGSPAYAKVTPDGSGILLAFFNEVFVFRITTGTSTSTSLDLKHTVECSARISCTPALTNDSTTAYFCSDSGCVEAIDIHSGIISPTKSQIDNRHGEKAAQELRIWEESAKGKSMRLVFAALCDGSVKYWDGSLQGRSTQVIGKSTSAHLSSPFSVLHSTFCLCRNYNTKGKVPGTVDVVSELGDGIARIHTVAFNRDRGALNINKTVQSTCSIEKRDFSDTSDVRWVQLPKINMPNDNCTCVATFSRRNVLVAGHFHIFEGNLRLWNTRTGENFYKSTSVEHGVFCVDVAPDDKLIASGSAGGHVCLWDVSDAPSGVMSLGIRQTLHWHKDLINLILFSSDMRLLFSADKTGNVVVWVTETYKILSRFSVGESIGRLAYFKSTTTNHEYLGVGISSGKCVLLKIADGTLIEVKWAAKSPMTTQLRGVFAETLGELEHYREKPFAEDYAILLNHERQVHSPSSDEGYCRNMIRAKRLDIENDCGCTAIARIDGSVLPDSLVSFKIIPDHENEPPLIGIAGRCPGYINAMRSELIIMHLRLAK